jgi:hypothetical protein
MLRTSLGTGRALAALITFAFSSACSDTNDVATAVTLSLYSVDGVVIPAPMTSAGGRSATIGKGFLQGTNWGHACGFSVGLTEGPLTAVDVPSCRLHPGEERTFSIVILDSRFPGGQHTYRFIPES